MRKFKRSRRPWRSMLVFTSAATIAACVGLAGGGSQPAGAASYDTAPAYRVVQEGLTPAEGARLADAFGIGNALLPNGAFAFVDGSRFAECRRRKGAEGKDESGHPTLSQALDMRGAHVDPARIRTPRRWPAPQKLVDLAGLSPDFKAEPTISHTQLTLTDREASRPEAGARHRPSRYQLTLGGLPATGQGAKLRITFAADGSVSQLSTRCARSSAAGDVAIISQGGRNRRCAALYADGRQAGRADARLLPARAHGRGRLGQGQRPAAPARVHVQPVGGKGPQAHRLLPAVPGCAPHAKVDGDEGRQRRVRRGDGRRRHASVHLQLVVVDDGHPGRATATAR